MSIKIKVPDAIKEKATLCQHGYSCLKTGCCGDRKMCKVDFAVGKLMLFLAPVEKALCSYRVSYGERQACVCPVHCYLEGQGLYKAG